MLDTTDTGRNECAECVAYADHWIVRREEAQPAPDRTLWLHRRSCGARKWENGPSEKYSVLGPPLRMMVFISYRFIYTWIRALSEKCSIPSAGQLASQPSSQTHHTWAVRNGKECAKQEKWRLRAWSGGAKRISVHLFQNGNACEMWSKLKWFFINRFQAWGLCKSKNAAIHRQSSASVSKRGRNASSSTRKKS